MILDEPDILIFFLSTTLLGAIQAVVFDCGGVVVQLDRQKMIEALAHRCNLSKEEAYALLKRYKQACIKGMNEEEFWKAELGDHFNSDWLQAFEEIKFNALKIDQRIMSIVVKLQEKGLQTPMLSNADLFQIETLKKRGIYDPFSPVLLSGEMGVEKPNCKAYEVLMDTLQLSPNEILFIDDNHENAVAAIKMGIDTIEYTSPEQLTSELLKREIDVTE